MVSKYVSEALGETYFYNLAARTSTEISSVWLSSIIKRADVHELFIHRNLISRRSETDIQLLTSIAHHFIYNLRYKSAMINIHTVFWSLYTAVGDTRMPCLKMPRMDNTPELAGGKYPLRDVGLAKGVLKCPDNIMPSHGATSVMTVQQASRHTVQSLQAMSWPHADAIEKLLPKIFILTICFPDFCKTHGERG